MLKAILSIFDIKNNKRIATVTSPANGANLIVQTTLGREVFTGVMEIVERGDFLVFRANGASGTGGVVARHAFISAIPE